PARSTASRDRSPARETASSTYSSMLRAMVSVRPTLDRWLSECRLANVSPGQVTTGTPIHKASQVVALPEKGKGSSTTSTWLYVAKYSAYELDGKKSSRWGPTPCV